MSTGASKAERVSGETRKLIGEHPLPSAMTAFGVGLGLGVAAAMLLSPERRAQSDAYSQRLLDALSRIVPDAVGRRVS